MIRIQFDLIDGPDDDDFDLESYIESSFPNEGCFSGLPSDEADEIGERFVFYTKETKGIRAFMDAVAKESQSKFKISERNATSSEIKGLGT